MKLWFLKKKRILLKTIYSIVFSFGGKLMMGEEYAKVSKRFLCSKNCERKIEEERNDWIRAEAKRIFEWTGLYLVK